MNALNEGIYQRMSLGRPGAQPEYIITRTRFQTPMYDGAVDPHPRALGVCTVEEWKAAGADGLVVLRSTVMDPFLVSPPPAPDHVTRLRGALCARRRTPPSRPEYLDNARGGGEHRRAWCQSRQHD